MTKEEILQRLGDIKDDSDLALMPISVTYRPHEQLAMADEAVINLKVRLDQTLCLVKLLIDDIKK